MKPSAKKRIHSITAFTLLDYPDHTACILWFAGCNMKCSYCYNPEIVFGKGKYSIPEILSFLEKRKGLLDAVVFSGGECLLHKETIDAMQSIKAMGFLVKVDTNGSLPDRLAAALKLQLIDYIALDFKATKRKTKNITKADFYYQFFESLSVIQKHGVTHEVRTTVHSDLLDEEDITEMIHLLEMNGYNGTYYLQHFRNESVTIAPLQHSNAADYKQLSSTKIQITMR
ncbi:anaerobic ribonucleoside-triphosphate reductase activating protein [Flavobacterium orientale]|uniref:Anaerobic ribonucleoside-triphosphate reductase activating protein n=1 Tax=Flavobacterium orientale TaxID=1756020 RepID=A0A917DFP0_9FLAO|nr:anaerobic ribonucleoside-triphosphate reductase activating protein [Flavobacterium orientale]GGD34438.1 anaerobic ribonucleoside-triphosphate reductase activating protein [Flavobacterium orientale]